MKATFLMSVCCALLAGLLAGCATPGRRARQNPAAFHQLSPTDQRLVLKGKIRPGMSHDAVFIAWGEPDWKLQGGKGSEECESWLYLRQLTIYAPFSSYALPSPSVELIQPHFSLGLRSFGGDAYGRDLFQLPHVLVNDVRLMRADFRSGVLHNYTIRHGSRYLTPIQ